MIGPRVSRRRSRVGVDFAAVALLAAVFVCGVAQQAWLVKKNLGYTAFHEDDLYIFITRRSWGIHPSIGYLRRTMYPLMTLIGGLWLKLTGGTWTSWLLLQGALSWLSCLFAALIARELFQREKADWRPPALAFALAALHPARIFNSTGAMEFPWVAASVSGAAFFWLRHLKYRKVRDLYAASFCILLATTAHFEGWLYASFFSLWLLYWLLKPAGGVARQHYIAACLIAWAYVAIFIIHAGDYYLGPFLGEQKRIHADQMITLGPEDSAQYRMMAPFGEALILFPVLCGFSCLALFRFRRDRKFSWPYLLWPIGGLTLLGICHILGLAASFQWYGTHTWAARQLLVPVAAGSVFLVPSRKRGRAVFAAIFILMVWSWQCLPRYCASYISDFGSGSIKAFALLTALQRDGILSDHARILSSPSEIKNHAHLPWKFRIPPLILAALPSQVLDPSPMALPAASEALILDRFWDFRSAGPFHYDVQSRPIYPSVFSLSATRLKALIGHEKIRLVFADGEQGNRLAGFMAQAAAFSSWRVFVLPRDRRLLETIRREAPGIARARLLVARTQP
jgi:hypothetical protein